MNKYLSNEDFDSFKTFILLMYITLNKKTIANTKKNYIEDKN